MTRKSGPRRVDHWLAGSDRSPKADRLTTVRFRSRRHRRCPPSNAGRLGAELSAAEGSMAGGGGDADLLANLKVEVGDLSPSHRSRKSWSTPPRTTPNNTSSQIDATDLLVRTFGNRIGRSARSAVVAPDCLGFAVEIDDIVDAAPKTSGYPRTTPDVGFMTN
jgi:hypothetical protein